MTTRCRSSSRQRGTNSRTPPMRHPGHVRALAIGQTEFAWKLYKACRAQSRCCVQQLTSGATGNVHFSPLIVHHALTMVYAGSRYESAELLRTALCLGSIEGDAAVNLAYGDVTRSLAAASAAATEAVSNSAIAAADEPMIKPTLELHVATRLYVPLTHCGLLDQYVTSLRVHYAADVAKVPFHTDRERACREINQWVEESTEQTVKDVVRTPHGLPTFVSLVLPSAVYFRAAWDKRFASGKAELAPFHNGPDEIVQVMTFKVRGNFRHGLVVSATCRVAEVPFADERYSLVLIVPVDIEQGLDDVEAKLTADVLVHLEEHLDKRSKVKLTLPRFRVDDALSLGRVLTDDMIGIGSVFARGKVNLSGISGNNNLHLSHVEHKVCFEMDHVRRTKVPKKQVETGEKKKKKEEAEKTNKNKNKEAEKTMEAPAPPPQVNDSSEAVTSTNEPPLAALNANGDHANESKEVAESLKTKKKEKAAKKTKTKPEVGKNEDGGMQEFKKEKSKKETSKKETSKKVEAKKPPPQKDSNRHLEFNRPFIYVVRDRHLGMLLLMGCVRKLSPPPSPVIGINSS